MFTVRRCYPQHIKLIKAQHAQMGEQIAALAEYYTDPAYWTYTHSAWVAERCIGAAGIMPVHDQRGFAWALLSDELFYHMRQANDTLLAYLQAYPFKRIETVVRADLPRASRWVERLGFVRETPEPMLHYFADGTHAYQYVRIK